MLQDFGAAARISHQMWRAETREEGAGEKLRQQYKRPVLPATKQAFNDCSAPRLQTTLRCLIVTDRLTYLHCA